MKEKRFTGYVDGHYVSGTFTEKDQDDFEAEGEALGELASSVGRGIKNVGKLALGALILGAIIRGSSDQG